MKISIDEIKERLSLPLPGEKAHIPFSPPGRATSSKVLKKSHDYKSSAVALTFFENVNQDVELILMQRPHYNGVHSNQICFPGGRKELVDKNLSQTAIRESNEEIGLKAENFNLLGKLTPVYVPVSSFKIQPILYSYSEIPVFKMDRREVADVFTFPFDLLFQNEIIKNTNIKLYNQTVLENVPYFDIQGRIVWGATALIMNELRSMFI